MLKKILTVVAMVALLGSCSKKEKLYIYNWCYYTPAAVVKQFEKEFGVRVYIDEYSSNEEMYAKLKSGGGNYDLIFPSQDYVEIMILQGMLHKLDHSLLPNLANIDPEVLARTTYDHDMSYSVPYYWGASGIIINTAKVPDYQLDWSIFAREDLRGRMTMLDDMREVIGAALTFLGYSGNTKNPAEIEEARKLIFEKWRPNLVKFDAEAFGKGYAQRDFWVVHGYAEIIFTEIAEDADLLRDTLFFIPPGTAYIDSMCILQNASNAELAHKFINFIHRPEIYAQFCGEFEFYPTVNVPAREVLTTPYHYTTDNLLRSEIKYDLGEALVLYNNAWFNSIRAGL